MTVGASRSDTSNDRLWTVEDVSYYLGVPIATLYQWRCAGQGPRSRRVGRYLRYLKSDVEAWVSSLEATGSS